VLPPAGPSGVVSVQVTFEKLEVRLGKLAGRGTIRLPSLSLTGWALTSEV
jgi:hypothetical protein